MPSQSDFETDADFRRGVGALLHDLMEQLDAIEDDAIEDVTLSAGGITIQFEDGSVFVLSQQTPTHELWLSANLTAWHFKHEGAWAERDSGVPMATVLGELVGGKLGRAVRLLV